MKNSVSLIGNTGSDPVIHTVGEKKVAKFSLATSESYKKDGEKITNTTWHNIILWSPLAEIAERFIKKGSQIAVDGKIVYRTYENKDGITKDITEIVCNNLILLGSKKDDRPANNEGQYQKSGKVTTGSMSDISELGNVDDFDPFK